MRCASLLETVTGRCATLRGDSCESVVAILFKHPENYCRLRVRGTRHAEVVWVSCAVPLAAPSSAVCGRRHDRDFQGLTLTDWTLHSTLRLCPFRRDGRCLLQVPCTTGILAADERWGRRGTFLLHIPISRERGWGTLEL